ncbi:hypothetical protein [Janibacter cremeus]|uniref:DUF4232 domain-containing protein n=1 Tax=Janibacter cremeus TaxID=1285192 RepID=A0A852VND3_9MICO|nr:hypothetical protein [Janibacter cremeus]NYF97636.1 hypothetical protein [Janibacter cremeus]
MTSEITSPSRRSVAKGAAWAVPAVAVAAAAPSLAASTNYCGTSPGFTVEAVCPPIDIDVLDGNSDSLYFEITNSSNDCTVEAGQTFTLASTNFVGATVEGLNALQVDAVVFGDDMQTGTIGRDIPPGEAVRVNVFPVAQLDVNGQVAGTTTLTIEGMPTTQDYTLVELDAFGLAGLTLAFCGEPQFILTTLLESLGEEVQELPAETVELLDALLGDAGLSLDNLLEGLGLGGILGGILG